MAEVTAQQSPVLKKKSASVNDVASLPATPALAFTLDLWVLTTSPRPEGQARKISVWRLLPQWFLESPWFTLCSFLSGGGRRGSEGPQLIPTLWGTRTCHPGLLPHPTHGCPHSLLPGHSALSPLFLWLLASFYPIAILVGLEGRAEYFI